jgi:hypothetical protein
LFSEQICEVQGEGVRYVLRKNEKKAARERHRLEDKLEKLTEKIAARNKSRNVKKLTGKARLTLGGRSVRHALRAEKELTRPGKIETSQWPCPCSCS